MLQQRIREYTKGKKEKKERRKKKRKAQANFLQVEIFVHLRD